MLVVDDSSTILRVVARILQRHGYEVACARDGVEGMQQLQVAGPFDLVLLDFVMPRKNGYQFVRELRASEQHRDMPVVLMSARTAAIGDRFVEQTGAVDALAKPFDARALVAVVGGVIAKRDQAKKGSPARALPLPEAMVSEAELDKQPPESEAPRVSQLAKADPLTRIIVDAISPALRELDPSDIKMPGQVEQAVHRGMQSAATADLIEAAAQISHNLESDVILSGRLGKLPLAEMMQLFQLRRQTGVMVVRHKSRLMTMWIREGMLDLAQSSGLEREFRLGRYLVRNTDITREELPSLLEQVEKEQLLGEWLIQNERITEEELFHALAHQTCELTYEVLRWPHGSFRLRDIPFSEEAERARLELGLGELALEGFRRVDEWRLMADTVDFNAVLISDRTALASIDHSKLSHDELALLDAIDGARTARQAIEYSRLATFDAVKAIFGFLQSRLVRAAQSAKLHPSDALPQAAGVATAAVAPLERPATLRHASSFVAAAPLAVDTGGGASVEAATSPPGSGDVAVPASTGGSSDSAEQSGPQQRSGSAAPAASEPPAQSGETNTSSAPPASREPQAGNSV